MGTNTRPELSRKTNWWIPKHRYYELKHFCFQYPDWIARLDELDGLPSFSPGCRERVDEGKIGNPTATFAEARVWLSNRIQMVRKAAYEACNHQFWYPFLVDAVTTGASYDILEAQKGIMPVSRNEWYDVYRKFFWCLDKIRE